MKNSTFKQTEIGEIPEEWNLKQLQELAEFSNGYAFSSRSFTSKSDAAIAVFKMGNIDLGGGIRITGKEDYVDQNIASKLSNYLTQKDDILMCMTDMKSSMNLLGHSARITNEKFLVNQRVGRIRPKDNVNHAFLYYYLNSRSYIEKIRTTARSGVQVNLTTEAIKNSLIKYPPLVEQQQIASILSSLDDKIELNRRMNKTLEEIGKALFNRWFVDFEFPNENGEPYKSSGGEMVEGELGEIPKGWKTKNLFELASYINGKAFKSKDFSAEGSPVIKIAELKNGISSGTNRTANEYEEKYLLKNKDILFSWSGSPDTSIDCFIWFSGKGWLNQHIFKVIPQNKLSNGFVYFLLKYFMARFISIAHDKKTTGLGHVTVSDLKRIKTALPDEIIFDAMLDNLFVTIYGNLKEIQALENARDSLLPRLMSGRIRVN